MFTQLRFQLVSPPGKPRAVVVPVLPGTHTSAAEIAALVRWLRSAGYPIALGEWDELLAATVH